MLRSSLGALTIWSTVGPARGLLPLGISRKTRGDLLAAYWNDLEGADGAIGKVDAGQ